MEEQNNGNEPEKAKQLTEGPPELPKPICPHCGMEPMMPLARQFNCGPARLLIVFCGKCRKVVPAAIWAKAQPQIQVPRGGPLVLP